MAENDQKGVKNAEPRQKIKYKEVNCAIKCALRKSLNDDFPEKEGIINEIREMSIECTKITRLASLLIHFVFYSIMDCGDDAKINEFFDVTDNCQKYNSPTEQVLKDYFYSVVTGYTESPEYPMNQYGREFLKMMQTFSVKPTNNRYMQNIFKNQYQQYHVNFKNNIVVHARKRIESFLKKAKNRQNPVPQNISSADKKRHRDGNYKSVHQTIRFLFDGTIEFDAELLTEFENICKPNSDNLCGLFYELKSDWFRLLPIFFRLQNHIFAQQQIVEQSEFRVRNFVVVPQTSFQRRHIHVDTLSMYSICNKLDSKLIKIGKTIKNHPHSHFTRSPSKLWDKIWNTEMNGYERFNYSIHTDGVAVSLCCTKVIQEMSDDEENREYLRECKQKLDNGEIEDAFGFDPGKRLAIAGVHRNLENGEERNICVKNGKFYRYTREHRRNEAKKNIDRIIQNQMAEDAMIYGIPPSNMCPLLYAEYAEHVLRFFNRSIEVYCKQSYARLNFEKYIDTFRGMDKLTKEIVQSRPALVFVGACNESSSSIIKGYRRVPNGSKFIRFFKRRKKCLALPVPEKRTTMMCSICRNRLMEPKRQSKPRYRTCLNCNPRMDIEILPATKVTTHMNPRKLKRERKKKRLEIEQQQQRIAQQTVDEDVDMEPAEMQRIASTQYGPFRPLEHPRPPRLLSKKAKYVKTDRSVDTNATRKVRVWNRDVNAGRNILCIGLAIVRGTPIDPVFTVHRLEDLQ